MPAQPANFFDEPGDAKKLAPPPPPPPKADVGGLVGDVASGAAAASGGVVKPVAKYAIDELTSAGRGAGHQLMEHARQREAELKRRDKEGLPGPVRFLQRTGQDLAAGGQLIGDAFSLGTFPAAAALHGTLIGPLAKGLKAAGVKNPEDQAASLIGPALWALGGEGGAADAIAAKQFGRLAPFEAKVAPKPAAPVAATSSAQPRKTTGQILKENVAAQRKAGVKKPSLAVASPGTPLHPATELVGRSIAGFPIRGAVRATERDLHASAEDIARRTGKPVTTQDAGKAVQEGVERFAKEPNESKQAREDLSDPTHQALVDVAKSTPARSESMGFGRKANILYEHVKRLIGNNQARMPLQRTTGALNELRALFNNPDMTAIFVDPTMFKLAKTLEEQGGKLSWDDANRLRTEIRETWMRNPEIRQKLGDAKISGLYHAISEDLEDGAELMGGPEARTAFNRVNTFYKAGMNRIDHALKRVFDAGSGDQVFAMLVKDAQEGGSRNLPRLNQVKNSLTPDEWHDFSSTVLAHMGLPEGGGTNAAWSFKTFLDNLNSLGTRFGEKPGRATDSGLKMLFDGAGRSEELEKLQAIAQISQLLKDLRVAEEWKRGMNPLDWGVIGAAATSLLHPVTGAIVLATDVIPSATMSWLATEPWFVDMLSKSLSSEKMSKSLTGMAQTMAEEAGKDPSKATELLKAAGAVAMAGHQIGIAEEKKAAGPDKPAGEKPNFFDEPDDKTDSPAPEEKGDANQLSGVEKASLTEGPDWQANHQAYVEGNLGFPIEVTSGYRSPAQNREAGGVSDSAHLDDKALDFHAPGKSQEDIARAWISSGAPWDQIIFEGPSTVHLSVDDRADKGGPRYQILRRRGSDGRWSYENITDHFKEGGQHSIASVAGMPAPVEFEDPTSYALMVPDDETPDDSQ